MANTLRIKRRASGSPGAPSSLANAELAYNEVDDVLYYGKGDSAGVATTIEAVGGKGAVVTLSGDQTIGGTKTFSSTITGSVSGNAATATKWATARDLSLTGDGSATLTAVDGTGNVSASLTLATVNSNVGTFTKLTVNGKGLVTAASAATLADLGATGADFSMNSYKLTNLAEPISGSDAATKTYVDNVAQGLDAKASVAWATTDNITLSGLSTQANGEWTGSLTAGDRILVKDQDAAAENGIYVAAAGAWSRAGDANTWDKLISAYVFIERGATQADTGWTCIADPGGTLDTTAVDWVQFGSASSYVAGNGLELTGNSFAVKLDGSTLALSSGGVKVADNYAGNSSLVTVGTITAGVWQGTAVAVGYGGTGLTAAITGLLKGNGTAYSAATAGTDYLSPDSTIDGGTF